MEEDKQPLEPLGVPPAYDPPAYAAEGPPHAGASYAPSPPYPGAGYAPGYPTAPYYGPSDPPSQFLKTPAANLSYQPLPCGSDPAVSPPPYGVGGNVASMPFPVQSTQVVYVNASSAGVIHQGGRGVGEGGFTESPGFQLGLACAVTFCCAWPIGLVAVGLAVAAYNRSVQGQHEAARKFGRASIGVSIASIVVGIILIAVIIGISVSSASWASYSSSRNNYNVYG